MNTNHLFIISFLLAVVVILIVLALILCCCHIIPSFIQNIRSRYKVKPIIEKTEENKQKAKNADAYKCQVVNPIQISIV